MKDSFEQIYFYVQEKRAIRQKFDIDVSTKGEGEREGRRRRRM